MQGREGVCLLPAGAYPLPSKEAPGTARLLLDLCLTFGMPSFIMHTLEAQGIARLLLDLRLTFGVPSFIRADRGGVFTATVMDHLRCLVMQIDFGLADHARSQGSVDRI